MAALAWLRYALVSSLLPKVGFPSHSFCCLSEVCAYFFSYAVFPNGKRLPSPDGNLPQLKQSLSEGRTHHNRTAPFSTAQRRSLHASEITPLHETKMTALSEKPEILVKKHIT